MSAGDGPIAGAAVGVGATEAARRELSEHEEIEIVRAEIDGRRRQAGEFDVLGQADAASTRRREADALAAILAS